MNKELILLCLIVVVVLLYIISSGQTMKFLKTAVIAAEKDLGSKTGQVKLLKVYSMFIEKFPIFSKLVPYVVFCSWVDASLDWMKETIEKNSSIKSYIEME